MACSTLHRCLPSHIRTLKKRHLEVQRWATGRRAARARAQSRRDVPVWPAGRGERAAHRRPRQAARASTSGHARRPSRSLQSLSTSRVEYP
eukprot:scaffold157402_cov40-Tisochrysis_lutea.AAC.1